MRPAAFYVLNPSNNYSAVFKDQALATEKAAVFRGLISPLFTPAQVAGFLLDVLAEFPELTAAQLVEYVEDMR